MRSIRLRLLSALALVLTASLCGNWRANAQDADQEWAVMPLLPADTLAAISIGDASFSHQRLQHTGAISQGPVRRGRPLPRRRFTGPLRADCGLPEQGLVTTPPQSQGCCTQIQRLVDGTAPWLAVSQAVQTCYPRQGHCGQTLALGVIGRFSRFLAVPG